MSRSVLYAVASLLLMGSCDDNEVCSIVGCNSGGYFAAGSLPESDLQPDAGRHASIEVCFNGSCNEFSIYSVPRSDHSVALGLLSKTPHSGLGIELAQGASGAPVQFEIYNSVRDEASFRDGDIYSLTITSADGRQLVDKAWAMTYRILEPNGHECGPTCRLLDVATEL